MGGIYIYVWGVCGSVEALEEERVGGHMSRACGEVSGEERVGRHLSRGVGSCQGKNRWVGTCLGEWGSVRGRENEWYTQAGWT